MSLRCLPGYNSDLSPELISHQGTIESISKFLPAHLATVLDQIYNDQNKRAKFYDIPLLIQIKQESIYMNPSDPKMMAKVLEPKLEALIKRDQTGLSSKFSLFPIRDEAIYKYAKVQESIFWSADEINFSGDKGAYDKLPAEKQNLIKCTLAFFMPADGIVSDNLVKRFLRDAESQEEAFFYIIQLAIEAIHNETYNTIAYELFGEEGMIELREIADKSEQIQAKANFMIEYTERPSPPLGSSPEIINKDRCVRLLAFGCSESIHFGTLFANIYFVPELAGTYQSNNLIGPDEHIHWTAAGDRYKRIGGLPDSEAYEIVKKAVDIEIQFIHWQLPKPIGTYDSTKLIKLAKTIADRLLNTFGHPNLYNEENVLPFMNRLSMIKKNNPYEVKGASYVRFSTSDHKSTKLESNPEIDPHNNPWDVDF